LHHTLGPEPRRVRVRSAHRRVDAAAGRAAGARAGCSAGVGTSAGAGAGQRRGAFLDARGLDGLGGGRAQRRLAPFSFLPHLFFCVFFFFFPKLKIGTRAKRKKKKKQPCLGMLRFRSGYSNFEKEKKKEKKREWESGPKLYSPFLNLLSFS
jgi:hypothetical protein